MKEANTEIIRAPDGSFDLNDSDNVCFLCEKPRYEPVFEVRHYGPPFLFQRCQCGLIKQTPMPNLKFFEWFFNSEGFFSSKEAKVPSIWGYYDFFADEACRLSTSRRRYRVLSSVLDVNHPLEIMKIGPATGTFLHVAQQHGHHAIGCDISARFIEYAREHYGIQIDHGRFEHLNYRDDQFDVILLLNVIENIPNQSEVLNSIYRTLKPDGYFILNFVDMHNNAVAWIQKSKYFLYRPPVCYMYTSGVLNRVLDKFGFRIVQCHRDIRYLHMEKIATLLGLRWALGIARLMRINRIQFPIYAYPSRIIVARKTSI